MLDSKEFISVVSKHIDKNFNVENQFVEYFVQELNKANFGITTEQAQHILNILEYTSKTTSKATVIAVTNALLELGVLKPE